MAEVSIIELIVYGIVGYTGIVLLIASAFKELPATKSQSAVRSIWLLAPIFCMYMLASAGGTIWLDDGHTETVLNYNVTSNTLVSNSTTTLLPNSITLVQPVWITLHILFFIMLLFYFIWNMLQLLVKRE